MLNLADLLRILPCLGIALAIFWLCPPSLVSTLAAHPERILGRASGGREACVMHTKGDLRSFSLRLAGDPEREDG